MQAFDMADYPRKTTGGAQSKSGKASRTGRAGRPVGKMNDFFGLLSGKTKKVATIEEMNEAAARGWAGKGRLEKQSASRGQ
jgi:hypothetical protein